MTTPVLAGFHPDPSVCRVREDYYLVNSTFEYLPGIPIHHSRDLVRWEPVGHVLTRPEQIPYATTGRGVFASTIRHHQGRFWVATTDVDRIDRGQMILSASDPAGPWSDPVFVEEAIGIDPDLAWDQDRCHLTWAGRDGISSIEVDPTTGRARGPVRMLWSGTGLAHPEGPHLIRRGRWWYLLIAEGGTERGHTVSIARAESLDGAFEPAPGNPILSHRSTTHPVQNTGHADLVETAEGRWAMVYLGVRPRGVTPGFHVNGRETFLAAVEWRDGWPVVDTDAFTVPTRPTHRWRDDFTAGWGHRWVSATRWRDQFARIHEGGLRLDAAERRSDFVGVRAQDEQWEFRADIADGDVDLVVRVDDDHRALLRVDGDLIQVEQSLVGFRALLAERPRETTTVRAYVRSRAGDDDGTRAGPDVLEFGVFIDGQRRAVAEVDGRYLSTEVAGGFTGRLIGFQPGRRASTITGVSYTAG